MTEDEHVLMSELGRVAASTAVLRGTLAALGSDETSQKIMAAYRLLCEAENRLIKRAARCVEEAEDA